MARLWSFFKTLLKGGKGISFDVLGTAGIAHKILVEVEKIVDKETEDKASGEFDSAIDCGNGTVV